jgi:MoaA/NifB/PqqE/SkfB family radical SAM enzyme
MAYLQITTKCNMTCEHCCYRCTMRGKHMPRKVWQKAIEWATQDDHVEIGGGEPTLHPDFWEIIGKCLGTFDLVWLATNGSQTNTALALAGLARKGAISCALSRDRFHDPIDQRVVKAFTRETGYSANEIVGPFYRHDNDCREIRDVSTSKSGFSPFRDPDMGGDPNNCPGCGLFVTPSGKIKVCGCLDSPIIGNVFDGILTHEPEDGWSDCWQKICPSRRLTKGKPVIV